MGPEKPRSALMPNHIRQGDSRRAFSSLGRHNGDPWHRWWEGRDGFMNLKRKSTEVVKWTLGKNLNLSPCRLLRVYDRLRHVLGRLHELLQGWEVTRVIDTTTRFS